MARGRWTTSVTQDTVAVLVFQGLTGIATVDLAASVAEARSAAAAGLRLEVELVQLQQEFTVRPSQVRLTVRVQLTDVPSRRVLGARVVEAIEAAPSDDPYGGVVAANRAVRRVLEDVVVFCGERAAERASSR